MKAILQNSIAGIVLFCALAGISVQAADYKQPVRQPDGPDAVPLLLPAAANGALLEAPVAPPRMAPELALATYQNRAERQLTDLGAYSDTTIIEAELPSTRQKGQFELQRTFLAPRSMAFKALRFVGDGFIKNNVIVRWLQSEVDRARKGVGAATALTDQNYHFAFKGYGQIGQRQVYVFQVKPRHKAAGLFKGRVFLDPYTGRIRRAEGRLVKSPSVFLKKIEFVQDYADFGDFTLPVHVHSEVSTRIVGRAIVDIQHTDYQAKSFSEIHSSDGGGGAGGAN